MKNIVLVSLSLFFIMAARFIFSGQPSAEFNDLNIIDKGLIILGVSGAMLFWFTMLADFFKNELLPNKVLWGFFLIFFSWVAATIYYVKYFLPRNR